jgi:8-oxo-dGTP pyrophosphatase MutT (NUDIX family)
MTAKLQHIGQQVITACVFIHQQFDGIEKLFWPKRADTKKFLPGVYELPGGHMDFGEDLVEGLRREIKEEFGMSVSIGDAFAAFTYANEIKGSHSVEIVFFAMLEDQFITSRPGGDDPENAIIRKGFALLRGVKPTF